MSYCCVEEIGPATRIGRRGSASVVYLKGVFTNLKGGSRSTRIKFVFNELKNFFIRCHSNSGKDVQLLMANLILVNYFFINFMKTPFKIHFALPIISACGCASTQSYAIITLSLPYSYNIVTL